MISVNEGLEMMYPEKQKIGTADLMDLKNSPMINTLSDRPDWDEWLMSIAFLVSLRSPDKSTKHGAILSNENHQILGIGYNGFVRGSDDDKMPQERPAKYRVILHAEVNCILNSQNLLFVKNCTMHITGMPCSNCFLQIVQSGVKKVVYGPVTSNCVDRDQVEVVNKLAKDHHIELRQFITPSHLVNMLEKYHYIKGVHDNPSEC